MELEEGYDDAIKGNLHQCANGSQDCMDSDWWVSVDNVHDIEDKKWNFTSDAERECYNDIEKEQHEKFPVWEPNAVRYPGTMVVHV